MNGGKTLRDFEDDVRAQIAERNAQLESFLQEGGEFPNLSEIFRYHAHIVTHEGDVIKGQDSENYWRRLKADNVEDFKFKEEPKLVTGQLKDPEQCEDHEVDFVVLEISEFSFKKGELKLKGFVDPINKHRKICTQDP